MAKAKMQGAGWHGQSIRHSNAKKTGRAGGQYSEVRVMPSHTRRKTNLKITEDQRGRTVEFSPANYFRKKTHDASNSKEEELEPRYDSRASFYGKAQVRTENGKKILKSYSTDVATIEDGRAHVNGEYSNTTMRHVKEFLKQNGFQADSTKQVIHDYGDKEAN